MITEPRITSVCWYSRSQLIFSEQDIPIPGKSRNRKVLLRAVNWSGIGCAGHIDKISRKGEPGKKGLSE
jgi:hypothetical protein